MSVHQWRTDIAGRFCLPWITSHWNYPIFQYLAPSGWFLKRLKHNWQHTNTGTPSVKKGVYVTWSSSTWYLFELWKSKLWTTAIASRSSYYQMVHNNKLCCLWGLCLGTLCGLNTTGPLMVLWQRNKPDSLFPCFQQDNVDYTRRQESLIV